MSDLYPDLGTDGEMLDMAAAADVLRDGPVGTHMIRVSAHAQPDPTGVAYTNQINTQFNPHSLRPPPAPASGKGKKTKETKGGRKKSKVSRRKHTGKYRKKRKGSKTRRR